MNSNKQTPDSTAIRVSLWRALHLIVDSKPYIFEDSMGLQLIQPPPDWQSRPDMHPEGTKGFRASIVARSRFIEDCVLNAYKNSCLQYVLLGAGLDCFGLKWGSQLTNLNIFEIDKPDTQTWKIQKIKEQGIEIPANLHFVPVDFEKKESWFESLIEHGFDKTKPAIVVSAGVSLYLSQQANIDNFKLFSQFAPKSQLVISFLLPTHLVLDEDRPAYEMVQERARQAGTPFVSLYSPKEFMDLALSPKNTKAIHFSREQIIEKYFKDRTDSFRPSSGEEYLIVEVAP